MPCFFPAMCVYKWTQIFQGRLCYPWKYLLVKPEGFPPRILDHEINYVLPVRKKKKPKHTPPPQIRVWENEFHCGCSLVWRLCFCLFTVGRVRGPPGVQGSWVLRKQSSVLRTQRTKSSATSHVRTSVRNREQENTPWSLAHSHPQAPLGRCCWIAFAVPSPSTQPRTRASRKW